MISCLRCPIVSETANSSCRHQTVYNSKSVCVHKSSLNLNLKCFMAWAHAKAQIICGYNPKAYLGSPRSPGICKGKKTELR